MAVPDENQPGTLGAPDAAASPAAAPDAAADPGAPIADPAVVPLDDSPSADQDKPAAMAPLPEPTNVLMEYPTFLPLEGKGWDDEGITLPLASDTLARSQEILQAQPNIDPTKTPEGRDWAIYAQEGRGSQVLGDYFQRTVQREGADFRQVVQSEHGPLAASAPKLQENTGGVKLTGEAAVLRVRHLMGLGTVVSVPLWHSGFWLTFKAPNDGAMLELHRRLTEEKISLGRATYGLAFANNSVFFAGTIMDFALNHVYDTSLKNKEDFRSKISSLDIPIIAWGLACTMWPRGFQYARSVLDQSVAPAKVIREKLNLSKLLFTDTQSLTPWQIAHMGKRHGNTMTDESVQRYRDEFTRGQGRTVEINDKLKMTLRVPSLDQYVTNGTRWVNNIVAMVDKSFATPRDGEQRDEYILNHGKATNFRQYGHWVSSIEAAGDVIDQPDTLDEIFDSLSSDESIRDAFFKAVREFMEDAMVAVVAVPTFEPDEQKLTLPRKPHLLPLDVLSTFFTLLVQKVDKVVGRP